MLLHWRELLSDSRVPFVKIELLRDNPIGVEDAAAILHEIERIDPELCRLIGAHLARAAGRDPRRPLRPPIARYRYALMRRYDRARDERRVVAAALARLQLESMAIPLAIWRQLRSRA